MHYGRMSAAAVVTWLVYLLISPLANSFLLGDLYAAQTAVFRPADQVPVVAGYAGSALGFLVFAYMFAKGYEGGLGAAEGIRFGVATGLLLSGFAVIGSYVTWPVTAGLAAGWVLDTLGEFTVYGLVTGAVYAPRPRLPHVRGPVRPRGPGTV
jgi:hypothetical protein